MEYMNVKQFINMNTQLRSEIELELKEMCNQSSRLKYDDLIEKVMDITEHKTPIEDYRITSFLIWLVEDLKDARMVNEDTWDMTIPEINEHIKVTGTEKYDWWFFEHSIDTIMNGLKREYEKRKAQGLIG